MSRPLLVCFAGGDDGDWLVERSDPIRGEGLPRVDRLAVLAGQARVHESHWTLRGVTSHARYLTAAEREALGAVEAPLGRREATRAALIPIKKRDAWWQLAQDERRAIFEERSRHIAASMKYMPAIARRLYHGRELGEPFDFLTWFEYAPDHAALFEELVAMLRSTEEWSYVER